MILKYMLLLYLISLACGMMTDSNFLIGKMIPVSYNYNNRMYADPISKVFQNFPGSIGSFYANYSKLRDGFWNLEPHEIKPQSFQERLIQNNKALKRRRVSQRIEPRRSRQILNDRNIQSKQVQNYYKNDNEIQQNLSHLLSMQNLFQKPLEQKKQKQEKELREKLNQRNKFVQRLYFDHALHGNPDD